MMKVFHLFLFGIGVLLMPAIGYACGSNADKKCCKKEVSNKAEKKDCCNDSKNNKKGCDGKCGHSNCTTSAPSYSFILISEIEFNVNYFVFSIEKQTFHELQAPTSKGFFSGWFIPKIS